MKRLVFISASPNDSVSFYRGRGTLCELERQCKNLEVIVTHQFDWAELQRCDAIYMQRPCFPEEIEIMKLAKMTSKKIWIDHDDDLFNIPTDNVAFQSFDNDEIRQRIITLVKNADIVTVQSEYLKEFYSKANKDVRVIPNAFNVDMFKYRSEEPPPRQKLVMWRGSVTHHRDVATVSEGIIELVEKYPDWKWEFIGDILWFVSDHIPKERFKYTKAMDIVKYHRYIYESAPSVFMVPLHDSVFNRNKSNIAWFEASFAGARTVAPNFPQWQQEGVINYNGPEDFAPALEKAMIETDQQKIQAARSWGKVKNCYNLRLINEQRIDILCELMDCTRKDLM